MISHGFVSGAMFLCIGVLYDRMHSRLIADYGGVVNTMPKFAALFMLFAMANSGLPGTSGFVGEFLVILGAVQFDFWVALAAAAAAWTVLVLRRRDARPTAGGVAVALVASTAAASVAGFVQGAQSVPAVLFVALGFAMCEVGGLTLVHRARAG
jgi:formate hydrogenlyase subunit 3/multisubunit Na+/H+ antiporter MnhD subunit